MAGKYEYQANYHVKAMKWDGTNTDEVLEFCEGRGIKKYDEFYKDEIIFVNNDPFPINVIVEKGNYVVKSMNGLNYQAYNYIFFENHFEYLGGNSND